MTPLQLAGLSVSEFVVCDKLVGEVACGEG